MKLKGGTNGMEDHIKGNVVNQTTKQMSYQIETPDTLFRTLAHTL